MANANFAFTSFVAGELSPRLTGRTDLQKYFQGCETLENFLIHPHGGATRRPGTRVVAEVKTSSLETRLVPFQFNVTQAYVLEFGNNYFRIYKDGGQVTSGSPATAVEVTTTYATADLATLKFAQSGDVMYVVHPEKPVRKIARTSHTAWTITDVDFKRGPFLDANTTDTTLTASGRTGSVTVTASAVTGINGGSGFESTDVGRLIKLHHGYAKITALTSTTVCTASVQENDVFDSELEPTYASNTISFAEGDPSSTGLEHNDRIVDSNKNWIDEGFKDNQEITVSGASTSGNNKSYLIVKATEDTLLLAPSDDVTDESASASITVVGKLVADDEWALGAFSPRTGYPRAVAFYEQRLTFAGTDEQPQTVYFSVSGDFENFTAGTDDDSALVYTLGSNQVNVIRFLSSSRSLLVGTSGGEFVVRAGGADEPITPNNVQIKQQAAFGSANVQPLQCGNAVLFLQRASRKIRELVYDFDTDGYIAPDLSILAEHATEGGVKEMAYGQEPDSVAWMVRNDGVLLGMTYRRDEQVVAWHRHVIGGVSGTATVTITDYANVAVGSTVELKKSDGTTVTFTSEAVGASDPSTALNWRPVTDNNTSATKLQTAINAHADFTATVSTNVVTIIETARAGTGYLTVATSDDTRLAATSQSHALVESIATIPGTAEDEVWLIVNRTINGATKRYVEYLKSFDFGSDVEDAFFVDSGLTYSGTSASSLSGLSHLEAENISINGNGATHSKKAVSSGAVTLDRSVTKAHAGLPFDSTMQTMRIEAGATDGSAQGKIKRIDEVNLRLYRSVNALVGNSLTNLDRIPFRSGADEMDEPIPLFTGDKEIDMPAGYDQDGYIYVRQDLPLPMTVIGIFARMQTYE